MKWYIRKFREAGVSGCWFISRKIQELWFKRFKWISSGNGTSGSGKCYELAVQVVHQDKWIKRYGVHQEL
jgi:hypothetical protein